MEYQSSTDINSSILSYTISSFSLRLTTYMKTCTWVHITLWKQNGILTNAWKNVIFQDEFNVHEETCIISQMKQSHFWPVSHSPPLQGRVVPIRFQPQLPHSGTWWDLEISPPWSAWQGKLPLSAHKPRQFVWTQFLPLFCKDSLKIYLSHLSPYTGPRNDRFFQQ